MRGGRWKRPSPAGPARRGLEARLRSVSVATTCRGCSGVCKERRSWNRGAAATTLAPRTSVPSCCPWRGLHVAPAQLPRAISSRPAHSRGAPAPADVGVMGLVIRDPWAGGDPDTGGRGPGPSPAHRCRRPPHAGPPSAPSPSPSCPRRASSAPWRKPCGWGRSTHAPGPPARTAGQRGGPGWGCIPSGRAGTHLHVGVLLGREPEDLARVLVEALDDVLHAEPPLRNRRQQQRQHCLQARVTGGRLLPLLLLQRVGGCGRGWSPGDLLPSPPCAPTPRSHPPGLTVVRGEAVDGVHVLPESLQVLAGAQCWPHGRPALPEAPQVVPAQEEVVRGHLARHRDPLLLRCLDEEDLGEPQ